MSLPTENKGRKAIPLYAFLTGYFPDAIVELVRVAVAGNEQHNPGEPLHWARGKSMDQLNTAMRHLFDHGQGATYDTEPDAVLAAIDFEGRGYRTMHLAKAAWRLLAEIQLLCEARAALDLMSLDAPTPPYVGLQETPPPPAVYTGERPRCWGCNAAQNDPHGPGCVAVATYDSI